MYQRALVVIRC